MSELARTIAAQDEAVAEMLSVDLDAVAERLTPARRIWLVGTGTSQHAAELGAMMFGGGERIVRWASGASFAWLDAPLGPDDGVVVISHTAETAFAGAARARALAAGARLVSITARGGPWPEAVQTIDRERAETYTASYLAAVVVLARLTLALEQSTLDQRDLDALPGAVRGAIDRGAPPVAAPQRLLVLAGVGPGAITAREGALKLREGARVLAEGYEAEYLVHGSAVPLGPADGLLAIAPSHDGSGLLPALATAAEREGLAVASVEEPGDLHPVLAQIPLTVRLQALASELADARGADPDTVITGAWAGDELWRAGAP